MKLGRQPRKFNPRVPHLSALLASSTRVLPPPLPAVDWTSVFAPGFNFGVMLNDQLGDCTCAGIYHARQIWDANANPPCDPEPDANVLETYREACGYKDGDPTTDNGGIEQDVLAFWLNHGVPVSTPQVAGATVDKLLAFFEIDVRSLDDVRRTIDWCGGCYIGMLIPSYIMGAIPTVWSVQTGDDHILGGHCVYLTGYDPVGPHFISWGVKYQMTWEYFARYVDEAYGLVDRLWATKTGKTPVGLSLEELQAQMVALKTT